MLTTKEAAERLDISPRRVRQLVIEEIIAAERIGRDFLIPESEVEKAKSRKTDPGPAPGTKKPRRKGAGK